MYPRLSFLHDARGEGPGPQARLHFRGFGHSMKTAAPMTSTLQKLSRAFDSFSVDAVSAQFRLRSTPPCFAIQRFQHREQIGSAIRRPTTTKENRGQTRSTLRRHRSSLRVSEEAVRFKFNF